MSGVETWRTWEGRVVEGKFPLRQWVGGSDHSAVFLTEHTGQDSGRAAIKLIAADRIRVDRQLSQWRAAAQLSHPNLIRIFQGGSCRIDETPLLYLVTEFADEDLSQILPQRPLAPAEVADMLPPLLDAIGYLHRKGLLHGRVKPSNILAVGEQLKLSADHVSSVFEGDDRRRDVYDAPETAAGIVSPESDLWSVGVTLLTALTQNPSFAKDSRGDPAIPPAIPEPFRGIVRECLHLDPKRRCSVSDILARLQPPARAVPAEPEAPPPPARRGISRGAIALAVVIVALVIGLVIFYSHGKQETSQAPAVEEKAPQQAPPVSSQPSKPAPTPAAALKPDSRGAAVRQVLPEVPQSARNTITGKIRVVVRVDVDNTGKVTAAKLTSTGPSHYFANLALKAAREWEFAPPTSHGQPIASVWALRFRFGRARTEAAPERLRR